MHFNVVHSSFKGWDITICRAVPCQSMRTILKKKIFSTKIWILLELRVMEVVAATGAIKQTCKVQVNMQNSSQIVAINKSTPNFLQGRCLSYHPTKQCQSTEVYQ